MWKLTFTFSLPDSDITLSYLPAFGVFKWTYPTRSSCDISHRFILPLSPISKVSSTYLTFPAMTFLSIYLVFFSIITIIDLSYMYLFPLSFHIVLSYLFSSTYLNFYPRKSSHWTVFYIFSLRFYFDISYIFYSMKYHIDLSYIFTPEISHQDLSYLFSPEISYRPI